MLVGQRVEDLFAVPAEFHQAGLFEDTKLMGDGALAHPQKLGDIADAHFMLQKHIENFDSGRIPENLKKLRKADQSFVVGGLLLQRINELLVNMAALADRHFKFFVLFHTATSLARQSRKIYI